MPDLSHLDDKYFIDPQIYNCPFCNRRHVTYSIIGALAFDWTDTKKAVAYFVRCGSCEKDSMHLSYSVLLDSAWSVRRFQNIDIDENLFFSVPSSFHVINDHIPSQLRELIAEAEGCLKSNFLTGASACVRKVVYELARREHAEGDSYEDRLKSLKTILPAVDATYFDSLLSIQKLTSDKVHEASYDGWQGKHLRLILATLLEVLREVYVVPKEREAKREGILALQREVFQPHKESDSESTP
jgi:transcription elongation factor Elf1